MIRRAHCACGALSVEAEGEPKVVSVCHCLECQRRTGSAFGLSARYPVDAVRIAGTGAEYRRSGDEGTTATFRFCPNCGTTLFWTADGLPDLVAIAVGGFADPEFPAPTRSVYEDRKHGWLGLPAGLERL